MLWKIKVDFQIESRVLFTMHPITSSSQTLRNDSIKGTDIQDVEERGESCRTMFW